MRFLFALLAIFLINPTLEDRASAQPLVSVEWLQENLKEKDLVVLDIRSPRKSRDFYAEGHIEGAISAPYNFGWRTTLNNVIGMLPPVAEIANHIGGLGISNNSHVVIVPFGNSSTDFSAATRIYWTFKVLGHDRVSILEGGYAAWLAKGQRLSKRQVQPTRGNFKAKFRAELVANELDVIQSLGEDIALVDARPAAQFTGKAKSPVVSKAGTIPEAVNLRQSKLYSPKSMRFLSDDDVDQSIAKLGITKEQRSITFCNTGHWASIAWFALSEIAGKDNVALYDGSMVEWTSKDSNPLQ